MEIDLLKKIGFIGEHFNFASVSELVEKGVISKPLDGNHGEIHPKASDYALEGIPFIMASDLKNGRVDTLGCYKIPPSIAESLRKGFAKNGDILLSHKATIGRVAKVSGISNDYIVLTPQVTYYRVLDNTALIRDYLAHYFRSQFFQDTLALWAGSGATRAYLGITAQGKLPVVYPDIEEQLKIAAILTAYDDLIENNRQRIVLLEKMAEEIYREWFVRLRFPGHEQTAVHKGVPTGWSRPRLESVATTIKRGISPKYDENAEAVVLNQKCIRNGSINLEPSRTHESRTPDEKLLQKYDALINSTGVGTLGRTAIVDFEPSGLTADSHVTICRADPEEIDLLFFASTIKIMQPVFESLSAGSTGQTELAAGLVKRLDMFLPPQELQEKFSTVVEPTITKKHYLSEQNQLLTQTRDLLLNRLISGKLRVDDLDIQFPPSMADEAASA